MRLILNGKQQKKLCTIYFIFDRVGERDSVLAKHRHTKELGWQGHMAWYKRHSASRCFMPSQIAVVAWRDAHDPSKRGAKGVFVFIADHGGDRVDAVIGGRE